MGGAVSAGENNDELIDNLVEANYIKNSDIAQIFRAVDRSQYYLPEHRENAYKDLAWKHGNLHLSAPCIYAEVMESLCLKHGMSFLNLGSGTGYLNTLAGLVIGPYGLNHGVELHQDVIEYAKERLEDFKKTNHSFDEYEFCDPDFVHGNGLLINSGVQLYDRVYCGAACPQEHENYMKNLVKIGGILVMPLNDQLLQIRRTGETEFETKNVLPVSFASLVTPTADKVLDIIGLPEPTVMTLQEICRVEIRRILRQTVKQNNSAILQRKPRPVKTKVKEARQRVNIMPVNMGMILMGQMGGHDSDREDDSSDSGSDSQLQRSTRRRRREEGPELEDPGSGAEAGGRAEQGAEEQEGDSENEDIPDLLRHMMRIHRRLLSRRDHEQRRSARAGLAEVESPLDDEDEGITDDIMPQAMSLKPTLNNGVSGLSDIPENEPNEELQDGLCYEDALKKTHQRAAHSSGDTSPLDDDLMMEGPGNSSSHAIPIGAGDNRVRCCSNTSVSTSYTSGIGTCSSLEDHQELDFTLDTHDELEESNQMNTCDDNDHVTSTEHVTSHFHKDSSNRFKIPDVSVDDGGIKNGAGFYEKKAGAKNRSINDIENRNTVTVDDCDLTNKSDMNENRKNGVSQQDCSNIVTNHNVSHLKEDIIKQTKKESSILNEDSTQGKTSLNQDDELDRHKDSSVTTDDDSFHDALNTNALFGATEELERGGGPPDVTISSATDASCDSSSKSEEGHMMDCHDDESDNNVTDGNDTKSVSTCKVSAIFSRLVREYVEQLPVPLALQQYLLFYRK